MLVLTRKEKEQITIGEGITITVYRIGKNTVRIGIEAPKETLVMRTEILERKQDNDKKVA